MNYADFIDSKRIKVEPCGFDALRNQIIPGLFPFQEAIVLWAIRRGRAAIFAATGLGKTRMQLAWAAYIADKLQRKVLILAPLAVAQQTADEGRRIGIDVSVAREQSQATALVNVTNYERLHRFDPAEFCGVVLDESSCIKHYDAKTLRRLLECFSNHKFRLCATATPSPNDYTELGTHAEFLGVCSRAEMLSEFFVHDGGDTSQWRLKGHARGAFWKWVSSWGAMVRSPSDLLDDTEGYVLPELKVEHHVIKAGTADAHSSGFVVPMEASTMSERRSARKGSIVRRVTECAKLVNADDETWIVWCDLNAESQALTESIRGAIEVRGSDAIDEKEAKLMAFSHGDARVIVTKPSIAGHGLNWQHCSRMAFVGVTDSWEAYFQAVRRCWRFGQKRPVQVHIFTSELEGAVVANLKRKEALATAMADELSVETRAAVLEEVLGQPSRMVQVYNPRKRMEVPAWMS